MYFLLLYVIVIDCLVRDDFLFASLSHFTLLERRDSREIKGLDRTEHRRIVRREIWVNKMEKILVAEVARPTMGVLQHSADAFLQAMRAPGRKACGLKQ
jgi:hypothetical protein